MPQRMDDLQTVAVVSPAYDPVADGDDGKEELEEVVEQDEVGDIEQDFPDAAFRLNVSENEEADEAVQDGLQQGNEGAARAHGNDPLFCCRFFRGDEPAAHGDQVEGIFLCAEHPGAGSGGYLPVRFSSGNPVAQRVAQFMEKNGQKAERPDQQDFCSDIHQSVPFGRRVFVRAAPAQDASGKKILIER